MRFIFPPYAWNMKPITLAKQTPAIRPDVQTVKQQTSSSSVSIACIIYFPLVTQEVTASPVERIRPEHIKLGSLDKHVEVWDEDGEVKILS